MAAVARFLPSAEEYHKLHGPAAVSTALGYSVHQVDSESEWCTTADTTQIDVQLRAKFIC